MGEEQAIQNLQFRLGVLAGAIAGTLMDSWLVVGVFAVLLVGFTTWDAIRASRSTPNG